jgi:hypothetical protein
MPERVVKLVVIWCLLPYWLVAQYAPVSTLGNVSTYSSTATVTIHVSNFINVTNCLLELRYDTNVAMATGATRTSVLGGTLIPLSNVPGVITLSWFTSPGVTLPDNSLIFNVFFTRVNSGITAITWYDDGYSCLWGDGDYNDLIDVPTANYYVDGSVNFKNSNVPHTIAPEVETCSGDFFDIPVKVTDFTDIGQLNLKLQYNPLAVIFQSWNNASGFPGLTVVVSGPGELNIYGLVPAGNQGITLPDSSVLISLKFFNQGGNSYCDWYDDGTSCFYTGPPPEYFELNDVPQGNFYFDGLITSLPLPGTTGNITGPAGGRVCLGDTGVIFEVDPVPNASIYSWSFPPGVYITAGTGTNSVTAEISTNAVNGNVTVYAINNCGNGTSSNPFVLDINTPPYIISQPVSPAAVLAGSGTATLFADAGGSQLTFQWQEFVSYWNNIVDGGVYSGVNTANLTILQPPLAMNGYRYRCLVEGFCPPVAITDGTATLMVTPIIGSQEIGQIKPYVRVSPNPITKNSMIHWELPNEFSLTYLIYGKSGETLFRSNEIRVKNGSFSTRIPMNFTAKGVYFLYTIMQQEKQIYTDCKKILYID